MSTPERRLPGWVLPVGLGLIVVALVAVALARGPVEFDSDTPEAAVQEYLVAIHEDRWDEAVEVIYEDWRRSCDGDDLRASDPGEFSAQLASSRSGFRTGILEAAISAQEPGVGPPAVPGDSVTVEVDIRHGGPGGWTERTVFELVDREGLWWLAGDPWPYFIWNCQER